MCTCSDMHALTHMHTGQLTSDYRVDGLMFFHTVLLSRPFIQICPGHTSLLADRLTWIMFLESFNYAAIIAQKLLFSILDYEITWYGNNGVCLLNSHIVQTAHASFVLSYLYRVMHVVFNVWSQPEMDGRTRYKPPLT